MGEDTWWGESSRRSVECMSMNAFKQRWMTKEAGRDGELNKWAGKKEKTSDGGRMKRRVKGRGQFEEFRRKVK